MPQRIEINVQTGERKVIELTPAEIAKAQAKKAVEDADNALKAIAAAAKASRQAKLDALLDKIEADPTILDRIR